MGEKGREKRGNGAVNFHVPGPAEVDDVDLLLGLVQVSADGAPAAAAVAHAAVVLRVHDAGLAVRLPVAPGAATGGGVAEDALLGSRPVRVVPALSQQPPEDVLGQVVGV